MLALLYRLVRFLVLSPFTVVVASVDRLRPRSRVLELLLDGRHPLRPVPRSPWSRRRDGVNRRHLAHVERRLQTDARVGTVLVRLGHLRGGWAEVGALRALVSRLRGPNRRVVAYLHHADLRALWVSSACDAVWLSPHGALDAAGLGIEQLYFGDAVERAGLQVEVVSAGAFKSAMEPFTRDAPSPESREALEALVGDLEERIVQDIATGRGRTVEAVREALNAAPLLAADALERGLVTAVVAEDDLDTELGTGPKARTRRVRAEAYAGRPRFFPVLFRRRPRLALVEVHGAIRDGALDEHTPDDGAGAAANVVCEALERAAEARGVRGVLLHIDSPGGSATASERMWRAVRRVAEKKPVIALMGDYAASGGYYVASAAHGIVAAPGTLTGSIGVISAKPVIGGLLERLGIHVHRVERGDRSSMFSLMRGYSPGEREALKGAIRQFYSLFLRRVAEGRGRAVEAIEPHAEGRVWTGAQAEARGLVDRLGHEHEALAWLEERSGADASRGLLLFGPRRPWMRRLLGSLMPGAQAELPWAVRALLARADAPPTGGVDATCEVRWSV